jgi:polyisoprenoid-binding protein YceI
MVLVGVVGYSILRAPEASGGPIQPIPLQISSDDQSSAAEPSATGSPTVYTIAPGQSQANFTIDEVLLNAPNTVIGSTSQVTGQIAVDLSDPGSAQVGTIQIDASTLVTDNNQRNNMIRRFILSTDEYPYISFAPTALQGLPSTITQGQSYPLQITGLLTIRDVTREVTFDATVTPVSAGQLTGSASTVIQYADWNISIPQVPLVAGTSDQVGLALNFVATAAS